VAAGTPRVVLVTRSTDLEALLVRHGTREQARFFLESRGQKIEDVEERHILVGKALQAISQAIPVTWRRLRLDRSDLASFLFEPEDLVLVLGQDGLVANAAKYLDGQLVLGVNPDPQRFEGILVPLAPIAVPDLLRSAGSGRAKVEERTMAEVQLDDGQTLLALNEIFVGHRSHQSAR
jgi:NAD kinase